MRRRAMTSSDRRSQVGSPFRGREWGRRGLTLVELMAVMLLIGTAAGVTLTNLGAITEAAQLRQTLGAVRDLDARARLHARTGTPIIMLTTQDGDGILIYDTSAGEAVGQLAVPATWRIHLTDPEGIPTAVYVDAAGRSGDYRVLLSRDRVVESLTCCGLTGVFIDDGEEGSP